MNLLSQLSPKKRAFLTGTLLLTASGFACRVLGFFYRIFLSRTIGAEGLGLYNMMHPVFGICFALCAGSVQTAVSQYIASHSHKGRSIFRTGLLLSGGMSLALAWLICSQAEFLAERVLMEPRCAPFLPLLGISVPFAAVHACINGYYYGMQKSRVPALSQIAEQMIRMAVVFFIADYWTGLGHTITVHLAVMGHLAGEAASAAFTFLCLCFCPPQREDLSQPKQASDPQDKTPAGKDQFPDSRQNTSDGRKSPACISSSLFSTALPLLALAVPLMANRLVLNLLASLEAIWIPTRLQMSGMANGDALAVYGVLTGMALPFILFPSAITNSISVLLLPSIAQDQAAGRYQSILSSIAMSLRYSMYMGIFSIGVFTLYGDALGTSVFHNENAGFYIQVLSWLCPFLYLSTTMGSILNGLGKTQTTFFHNTISLVLRIGFVYFGIPRFGILALLVGMLLCEILLALLHLAALHKSIPFTWDAWEMIVKPCIFLVISVGIHYFVEGLLPTDELLPVFMETALHILLLGGCYGGLLLVFHMAKQVSACVSDTM